MLLLLFGFLFLFSVFFFKQKTAYEMRISDWSSDVCSSDLRAGQVDQVIVALPWSAEGRLQEVVGQLALTPVRIRLAPDLANFAFSQRPVMMLGEVPVLSLFDRPISGFHHAVQWLEDKILTIEILALIWPLLLLVAIVVKLHSPGPVF